MGRAYSADLRLRVLDAIEGGMSKMTAHRTFRVSRSTIDKWITRRRATGSVQAKSGYHKGRALALGEVASFEAFAQRHQGATLEQMSRAWQEESGHLVSRNTFSLMLARIGWTRKKRVVSTPSATPSSGNASFKS